jgi:hypothetical protein
MQGWFKGAWGGVGGDKGVFRVFVASETAQVELRSGRV